LGKGSGGKEEAKGGGGSRGREGGGGEGGGGVDLDSRHHGHHLVHQLLEELVHLHPVFRGSESHPLQRCIAGLPRNVHVVPFGHVIAELVPRRVARRVVELDGATHDDAIVASGRPSLIDNALGLRNEERSMLLNHDGRKRGGALCLLSLRM
jgi:hypothetical protein